MRVRVWDLWVRIGHWLLVLLVAAAWYTRHGGGRWHEYLGYGALAVCVLRIGRGFFGAGHVRFDSFVVVPRAMVGYARSLVSHAERRYLGHNPLGGYMIVALLATVTLTAATGWLYTTDRYWGVSWVEWLHGRLSDLLLVLIAVHVAGVAFASWRERENLVATMLHGYRKAPTADNEDRNR